MSEVGSTMLKSDPGIIFVAGLRSPTLMANAQPNAPYSWRAQKPTVSTRIARRSSLIESRDPRANSVFRVTLVQNQDARKVSFAGLQSGIISIGPAYERTSRMKTCNRAHNVLCPVVLSYN